MIYIEKNNINRVVLTLTETSTLSNPNYLFVFDNEFNNPSNPIYFTTPDLSTYPNRYNLFNIDENISGSTSGGTAVSLNLVPGQYKYDVYESTASTLSISATTGTIIETGRMVVNDITTTSTDEIIPSQNNLTNNIYD